MSWGYESPGQSHICKDMTPENALQFVRKWNYPFWKLYKGKERVSVCDKDENPDENPEISFQRFKEEIGYRSAGTYTVNVYSKSRGESGGQKFEFQVSQNYGNSMNGHGAMMNIETMREQIRNELEMKATLLRIENKVDAIADFLITQFNDDEKDDLSGLKKLADVFKTLRGFSSAPAAAETASRSFSPSVSKGYFS